MVTHLHLYITDRLCENCVNDVCVSIIFLDSSDDVDQQGGQLTPEQDALQHIKACKDKSFLKEMFINSTKGWTPLVAVMVVFVNWLLDSAPVDC